MAGATDDSIWQFIPVSDYACPTEPPAEQIRTGLVALFGRLRRGATTLTQEVEEEGPDQDKPDIEQDVEAIAPWPDWRVPGVNALSDALAPWRDAPDAEAGCRVIVAPPHSHVESILAAWAQRHSYRVLTPPTYQQILHKPESWLEKLPLESKERFVIVALERCYLRHYKGLDLVRRLIRRVWQAQLPCVIGCDSWAWAYLDFACQADMLQRTPLTLAPLEAEAISRWIAAAGARPERVYRRTDSGVEVYPIHDRDADKTDETEANFTNEFLVHVAAHARGIPGVVWALWRKSLALTDQDEVEQKARLATEDDMINDAEKGAEKNKSTVWVKKWETLELPAIPATLDDAGAFALHAILLHGGLRFDELEFLAPGAAHQLAYNIRALQGAGIIEMTDDRFYVTPLGYPTARSFLAEESFLVDGLA